MAVASPWFTRLPPGREFERVLPRVKDDGWFGSSYQNLSPRREWLNCVAIRQAKVGPSMLPGSGLSDTPPDHKSTSEGCLKRSATKMKPLFLNTLYLVRLVRWLNNEIQNLIDWPFGTPKVPLCRLLQMCNTYSKIVLYRLTVSFGMEPNSSSKVFATGRPQYFLEFTKSRNYRSLRTFFDDLNFLIVRKNEFSRWLNSSLILLSFSFTSVHSSVLFHLSCVCSVQ